MWVGYALAVFVLVVALLSFGLVIHGLCLSLTSLRLCFGWCYVSVFGFSVFLQCLWFSSYLIIFEVAFVWQCFLRLHLITMVEFVLVLALALFGIGHSLAVFVLFLALVVFRFVRALSVFILPLTLAVFIWPFCCLHFHGITSFAWFGPYFGLLGDDYCRSSSHWSVVTYSKKQLHSWDMISHAQSHAANF